MILILCISCSLNVHKRAGKSIKRVPNISILSELFIMFYLSRFIVWNIYSKLVSYHPHSTALLHKWRCFYWSVNVAPYQSTLFIQVNNDVIFAWHSHSGYANDNNVFLSESKKRNVNIRNYLSKFVVARPQGGPLIYK